MTDLITQLSTILSLMAIHAPEALLIVGVLWGIHFLNVLVGYRLAIFGVYPRHPWGLVGIPCSPLLHGSFNHLFFNSIPLVVLIDLILLNGQSQLICVSVIVIACSGALTWLFGRKAIHIGASSVVMGYWGFLLIRAYYYPSVTALVLAIVCLYYFGGLFTSFFPTEEKVSWEGHIFGFLGGVAAVYFCPWVG